MHSFVCHRCGNCCRWEGEVRLQTAEAEDIAQYLQLPVEEFTERYTDLAEDRSCLVLKCASDGTCCFLDEGNLCLVQPVKPRQCVEFPYSWKPTPEQAKHCPGLARMEEDFACGGESVPRKEKGGV